MQEATSCPVHDPREQDDGKDEQNDPREEHHDAGNRVPGHGSGSGHGRAGTRLRLSYSIQITRRGLLCLTASPGTARFGQPTSARTIE
jgi:hypothetical protein